MKRRKASAQKKLDPPHSGSWSNGSCSRDRFRGVFASFVFIWIKPHFYILSLLRRRPFQIVKHERVSPEVSLSQFNHRNEPIPLSSSTTQINKKETEGGHQQIHSNRLKLRGVPMCRWVLDSMQLNCERSCEAWNNVRCRICAKLLPR